MHPWCVCVCVWLVPHWGEEIGVLVGVWCVCLVPHWGEEIGALVWVCGGVAVLEGCYRKSLVVTQSCVLSWCTRRKMRVVTK